MRVKLCVGRESGLDSAIDHTRNPALLTSECWHWPAWRAEARSNSFTASAREWRPHLELRECVHQGSKGTELCMPPQSRSIRGTFGE